MGGGDFFFFFFLPLTISGIVLSFLNHDDNIVRNGSCLGAK